MLAQIPIASITWETSHVEIALCNKTTSIQLQDQQLSQFTELPHHKYLASLIAEFKINSGFLTYQRGLY